MLEKLVPIEVPPGIVRNGTLHERKGRWIDGNLVRFVEGGVPQAIQGHITLQLDSALPGGAPRGAAFYIGGASGLTIVVGTTTKQYLLDYSYSYPTLDHEVDDITPVGLATGSGIEWWQFAELGENLVGVTSNGEVTESADGAVATLITPDAFAVYRGVVVTPQNFLVLLRYGGVSGDLHSVQWASQGTTDTFTPASSNSAGSLPVPCGGAMMAAHNVRGETLIWTQADLWSLDYIGAPLYYGTRFISGQCGVIAPRAVAVAGNSAFWMGERGFFRYDGFASPIICDIADDIFPNLEPSKMHLVHAVVVGDRNEIWWFWPFTSGTSCNRVAIYNYKNGTWSKGTLSRSAGVSDDRWPLSGASSNLQTIRTVPVMFDEDGATVYEHEQAGSVQASAFIESGPVMLDPGGHRVMRIQKLVPDDNQTAGTETLTVYAGTYPKAAEESQALTVLAAGGPLDVRLTGRYIRFKHTLSREASRVGTWFAGILPLGTR
jgi:hypothetical protein